jgi:tRNA dimethylallyltransferase
VVQETPLIALFGPTASGKTAAAMEIARQVGGEIVSVDSGQIYRGLNIGTAKPTAVERARVSFHLVDIADPDLKFSAAMFRERAIEAIDDTRSRGKRPVLTVGTGLYFRALEKGLFEGPSRDDAVRAELEERIRREGVEPLHRELEKVDPIAAASIPSTNRHRIIRALEVYRLTGRPISEFWKEHERSRGAVSAPGREDPAPTFLKLGLDLPKEELNRRIEERVEGMIEQGLLAEVRNLLERWGEAAPAFQLIGYKEIASYLRGKASLEEAVALIIKNTKQYAKRQRTWFKKDKEISWFTDTNGMIQCLTKK